MSRFDQTRPNLDGIPQSETKVDRRLWRPFLMAVRCDVRGRLCSRAARPV